MSNRSASPGGMHRRVHPDMHEVRSPTKREQAVVRAEAALRECFAELLGALTALHLGQRRQAFRFVRKAFLSMSAAYALLWPRAAREGDLS